MQDNLPELRDIHLPLTEISFFPPAWGWWVMLAVLATLGVAVWLIRTALRKSKKRYALRLLENARRPDPASAVKMSQILRRICVYKYKSAAALFGIDWIEFLNRHSKVKISGKAARLLLDAPYMNAASKSYDSSDIADLYRFCRSWIGENL